VSLTVPIDQPHSHREDDAKAHVLPEGDIDAEYFALREFACGDGTPVVLLHPALVHHLDRLRDECGVTRVTSGFRTGAYNDRVGGVDDSRHIYGMAADVRVQGLPPTAVARWGTDHGFGGVGLYDRFVHVDVWGNGRRWGGA
jgi:uncharacterized protein YcbK (DUF882 family)